MSKRIHGNPKGLYEIPPSVYAEYDKDLGDEEYAEYRCEHCDGAKCEECYNTGNRFVETIINSMLWRPTNIEIPMTKTKEPTMIQVIPGGRINGTSVGPVPSDVMVVSDELETISAACQTHFHVPTNTATQTPGSVLTSIMKEANIPLEVYGEWYFTSVLKFLPPGRIGATIPAEYYKILNFLLSHEIHAVNPKVIILMGATATKYLMGNKARFSSYVGSGYKLHSLYELGAVFDKAGTPEDEEHLVDGFDGIDVICTQSSRAILFNTFLTGDSVNDMLKVQGLLNGEVESTANSKEYVYIETMDGLRQWVTKLYSLNIYAIDCEWGGRDVNYGYLRSLQISWAPHTSLVITFYKEHGQPTELAFELDIEGIQKNPVYSEEACDLLAALFKRPGVELVGHNARVDLIWLIEHLGMEGVDRKLTFDTMLAHHALNDTLPHDLTYLSRTLTDLGVYDSELEKYKKDNGIKEADLDAESYGMLPYEILKEYSAKDTDATFQCYLELKKEVDADPEIRRVFYEVIMPVTPPLLEMERTGLKVDVPAITALIAQYSRAFDSVLAKLKEITNTPTFNPASTKQVALLLFGEPLRDETSGNLIQLGLKPVKATGKHSMLWEDVLDDPLYKRDLPYTGQPSFNISTDGETITEVAGALDAEYCDHFRTKYGQDATDADLAHAKNVVRVLLDFRLISQMVKNFLRPKDASGSYDGGLMHYIKPDGRIATSLSQMTGTGRYSSKKPNLQNLIKNGEYDLIDAAARALSISKDKIAQLRSVFVAPKGRMFIEADYSSAETFTLAYLSHDDAMVTDAFADPHSRNAVGLLGAPEYEGYKELKKPQEEWKEKHNAKRAGAKELSFGIPYGKQKKAMARSITIKSGTLCTEEQAGGYIEAWHKKYSNASKFLEESALSAVTKWYVQLPSGRRRNFPPTKDRKKLSAYKREAFNAPIQGAVGDLLSLALIELDKYRRRPGCPQFDILLVIHDAILVECDIVDIKEVTEAVRYAMSEAAKIPIIDKTLGCDVEYSFRWCAKLSGKKKELINDLLGV